MRGVLCFFLCLFFVFKGFFVVLFCVCFFFSPNFLECLRMFADTG